MSDPKAQAPFPVTPERELETIEQPRPVPPKVSVFTLEVVEGPDKGKSFIIRPDSGMPVLLGQSSACAISLTDRSVSRRHLSFDLSDSQLRVTDLESTNGTLINDVVAVEALLRGGEVVHAGSTVLRVSRGLEHVAPAPRRTQFGRYLGASVAMQGVYRSCDEVLANTSSLIIEGEPGTGKELLAEVLHERGPRARGPYVVVDASSDAAQIEKDLADWSGEVLGAAAGGTLLVREVGDLSAAAQQQLAKWLTSKRETSSAATASAGHFDVRLITTSSRNLDHEVQERRFSAELAELVTQARIELPPLRKREGDIPLLAQHFWAAFGGPASGLSSDMIRRLDARAWPNNVKELRLAIARLCGPREEPSSTREIDAAKSFEGLIAAELPWARARELMMELFERLYTERMLAAHYGNVSRAAESAGIARRYFQIVKSRHAKRDNATTSPGGAPSDRTPPTAEKP